MADGAQESLQIEVRAGETTVLEIVASPKSGSANERGLGSGSGAQTGSLEVQMLDEQGKPARAGSLYLLAKDGTALEMKIDDRGFGSLPSVPVGDYELTLQKPAQSGDERFIGQISFSLGQTALPADAKAILDKVLEQVIQSEVGHRGIHRITAHGYACNTPSFDSRDYSFERAKAAKAALVTKKESLELGWLELAMEHHGQQPGDGDAERAKNRRVDFIHRPPAKT